MRKIYLSLIATLMSCCIWAQSNATGGITAKAVSEENVSISWLTDETRVTSYSTFATAQSAFMEFKAEDIFNFNKKKQKISVIKQIQFVIGEGSKSSISGCKVVIMQGNDINTASSVSEQNVDAEGLTEDGWNIVNLETPYTVDPSKSLFIGYEVTLSNTEKIYPMAVTNGSNAKQAWIGPPFQSVSSNRHVFLIKALADVEETPAVEIGLTVFNLADYATTGEQVSVGGTVKNFGSEPITSFKVKYNVDGTESDVHEITGVNIASNATYKFSHPVPFKSETAKYTLVTLKVSDPNATEDFIGNNTLSKNIIIIPEENPVQKVVLHEGFSSSTCGPCNAGNVALKRVLDAADSERYALIKYQWDFPGYGDPYFTLESRSRLSYYNGQNSVPQVFIEGLGYTGLPSGYSTATFNRLANVPAFVKLKGEAIINGQTVSSKITIDPIFNTDNENLRLFAAIVEKTTTKNVKTNGEKTFYSIMKAFMTDVNGNTVESLEVGKQKELTFEYTFNGEYRLPKGSADRYENDIIDPSKEHSVENFENLQLVYWVQDIESKQVYQAGKTDIKRGESISDYENSASGIKIFPNPVKEMFNIQSDIAFVKIEVINMFGQIVKEINTNASEYTVEVNEIPTGMYLVRITNEAGNISTQKIQIR